MKKKQSKVTATKFYDNQRKLFQYRSLVKSILRECIDISDHSNPTSKYLLNKIVKVIYRIAENEEF